MLKDKYAKESDKPEDKINKSVIPDEYYAIAEMLEKIEQHIRQNKK